METGAVLVLGDTGAGKSSVLNALLGTDHFESSSSSLACTKEPSSFSQVIDNEKTLVGIDSEGFNDGTSITEFQIEKLGKFLRNWTTGINLIAVVIQFQKCRFSQGIMDVVQFVYNAFQNPELLSHICIIFTHSPKKCNKEEKIANYNVAAKQYLTSISGVNDIPDIPMFFVQTRKKERQDVADELQKIRQLIFSKSVLWTKEVHDALFGYKEEIETQNHVSLGFVTVGNMKKQKFIDRQRKVTIPNNGSAKNYSEWQTIRGPYYEDVEEERTEYDREIYAGYEYSNDGMIRYKAYYDKYRTVVYNFKQGKITQSSGWFETNRRRYVDARKEIIDEEKVERDLVQTTPSQYIYKKYWMKRQKIIGFDKEVTNTNWEKTGRYEYEYEDRPVEVVYDDELILALMLQLLFPTRQR